MVNSASENPYQPPTSNLETAESVGRAPAAFMLLMGIGGLIFVGLLGVLAVRRYRNDAIPTAVGILVLGILLAILNVELIRVAIKMAKDFRSYNARAGLLSVFCGAVLFPIMTGPAAIVVWLINRRNKSLKTATSQTSLDLRKASKKLRIPTV